MSMIDLFKEFHSQTKWEDYPVSARLLGYWFIGEFNEARWHEELRYSERELSRLTGLPPATVHRAIKYLCDRGHLKTWRKKNGTVTIFKLLGDNVPAKQTRSNSEVQAEQQRSTNEAVAKRSSAVPIKRVCEDLKTLDNKTESLKLTLASACDTYELDILLEYWSEAGGCKMNGLLASKLGVLLKKHGLAKMKETLDLANRKLNGEYGFNLEFFEKKLAEIEKVKGGESVAKSSAGFSYKPVTFDDSKPEW